MTTPKVFRVPDASGDSIFTNEAQAERYSTNPPDVKDEAGERAMLIEVCVPSLPDDMPVSISRDDAAEHLRLILAGGWSSQEEAAFVLAIAALSSDAKDKRIAELESMVVSIREQALEVTSNLIQRAEAAEAALKSMQHRTIGLQTFGAAESLSRSTGTEDAGVRTLVDEWRPIETAPMDQEVLLGAYYNSGIWDQAIGQWHAWNKRWPPLGQSFPTHWRPLPAAPVPNATRRT